MSDAYAPFRYETSHGAVSRCACCGRLEVHFAGTVLRGPCARFRAFAREVEATCATRGSDADAWTITLWHADTDEKAASLSADQALTLSRLLRRALKALVLRDRRHGQGRGRSLNGSSDAPGL